MGLGEATKHLAGTHLQVFDRAETTVPSGGIRVRLGISCEMLRSR